MKIRRTFNFLHIWISLYNKLLKDSISASLLFSGHENCVPRSCQLKFRPFRQMQTFEVQVHRQLGQEKGTSDLMCHTELQASSVADLLICGSQTFFVQKMAEDVISRWARRRLDFIPFSCHSPISVSNMRLACHSYPAEGRCQPLVQLLTWLASLCLRAWSWI